MAESRLLVVDDILDRTFEVPSDVLFERVNGETVLLHLSSGDYYGLNAVGSRIWELVENGLSVRQVLDALVAEFDASQQQLRDDLTMFIQNLMDRGLVHLKQEGHG